MKAIIIAGGEGTRLRPLTYFTPKPLLPLCGKPIIEHQIELCRRHGLREIIVNLHYLADELEQRLQDGSQLGVRIWYSRERTPLGTAGAVKLAYPYFADDLVVVFNGDVLTDLDLTALLEFHKQQGASATLTVTEVADPTPFGLVLCDAHGKISGFLEKPSRQEALARTARFFINAGTYVLHPSIFEDIPPDTNWSFERQVFPSLLKNQVSCYAFHSSAYWLDVGSPAAYLKAHHDLLDGALAKPKSWRAWPSQAAPLVWLDGEVKLPHDLLVEEGPVFIGSGASLGAGVRLGRHTVIGSAAILADDVRVAGAIVGPGAFIGPRSEILGGIVGAGSRIDSDVKLHSDALLADSSIIGRGTCLV